ncbi:TIGR02450 family Trp-rich protein [Marinomonas piezotolerans]|uniref:TIGR02450 family Trp-rich protein n=1 Tax=Marinomonas piezotolerans TaxID=2213058 RepID=A0A370U8N4_9GAMM|nr:TIGR02450 family Trp-rich protein [Marinomonas piezotolerans]RDL44134.1 TIGR02450 family Trp-rich protein [Marinomonas piezotolerans]
MKKINPNKLYLSKWTSATPKNKEKHFIVTQLLRNEENEVVDITLEAIHSKKEYQLPWQTLREDHWLQGWK